jgi:cytochrome P450/NADPH-cytochrome P450 reductase
VLTETPSIPQPRTYGPLGNLPTIDTERLIRSITQLASQYGPIFRRDLGGTPRLFISSRDLVADVALR